MLSIFFIILGVGCLFFGVIPLIFYRIFHPGVLTLLAAGCLLTALGYLWNRPVLKTKPKCKKGLLGILLAGFLTGVGISLPMLYYGFFSPPPQDGQVTVVVLGCQVLGDQPSLMLRRRLDTALEYLSINPQASAVLAGGRGDGEDYSEAYVMKRYLTAKGIDPSRLYQEDTSTNTRENLLYSASVILENQLSTQIVLVTDAFHQWRGTLYGKSAGLTVLGNCSSATPWGLLPSYWVREFYGLLVSWTVL